MRKMFALGLLSAALIGAAVSPGLAAEGYDLTLSTEYRYRVADRSGSNATDHDWYNWLSADVNPLVRDDLSFSTLIWYGADLNGTSESNPFKDTLDSYDGRDSLRVYRALVTYDPTDVFTLLAGRQDIWSAQHVTLDGALVRLECPTRRHQLELFGGSRVSFYSSPDDKAVWGGNLDLRPTDSTLIKISDLYYIENTLEAQWVQQFGDRVWSRVGYRHYATDPLDLYGYFDVATWKGGEVELYYRRKFSDADDSFAYDFTDIDGDEVDAVNFAPFAPYSDYGFEVRQFVNANINGFVRLGKHNLVDDSDEDEYNTDYLEGALGLRVSNWPLEGLQVDFSANRWVESRERNDLDEENAWGAVISGEQKIGDHKAGLSFHRSAYDALGAKRDTQGVALWGNVYICEFADLDLRYEYDKDDLYKDDGIDSITELRARLNLRY